MPRYFIEVAYRGTRYSGFQVQHNANTIQAEVARALKIFFKKDFDLYGSSRTDAGVHALQNFFHTNFETVVNNDIIYNLNALLPYDIVIKNFFETEPNAHCRFDAVARTYHYFIHRSKNPFLYDTSFYYPFNIQLDFLQELSAIILNYNDFTSFSKKHTTVKSFFCNIEYSRWVIENNILRYEIKGNRFLRGMVKGLVGTMLKLAKQNKNPDDFIKILEEKNCAAADFSVPSKGLLLNKIDFKPGIFLL